MSLRYLLRGQMKYMASKGIEVKMASASGTEVEEVVSFENCSHQVFPFTRALTPFQDFLTLIKLVHWLRQEKFNVVHSHTPKAGVLAMLAAYLVGVPIRMHTIAGIPWMEAKGFKRLLLKNVDRLAYRFATNVYPNSVELQKFVRQERLVSEHKLKVLGEGSTNGIDTEFFSQEQIKESKQALRTQYDVPEASFVFVFVGRIVRDKGMNELAEAFAQLSMDCHLLLVGPIEHELDPLSLDTLAFFKSAANVHLLGYQTDVRPFYKMADALVFPSYREGFPNVPLQAGAMELPSIVSDINGCNEIIEEGENGLIIPPKNENALLESMKKIMNNGQTYGDMKSRAREMIVKRYDQKLMHELIYREYQRLYQNVS